MRSTGPCRESSVLTCILVKLLERGDGIIHKLLALPEELLVSFRVW